MNTSTPQAAAHWLGKISPTLFVILSFICWKASSSPDGKVSQSTGDIAAATDLARRTVGPGLHALAKLGAIEILSVGKERMVIQIPTRYWFPPVNVSKPEVAPSSVPELIFRLCGQRPSPEMFTLMEAAAENDELRLQHCLDSFLHQGKEWTTLELLAVAVQADLRRRRLL